MKLNFEDFTIKTCDINSLDDILTLQAKVFETLPDKDTLRYNSEDMLRECLIEPNITIGAYYNDILVGFSVLYFPKSNQENLSLSLENVNLDNTTSANYKLCMVSDDFRGNQLQTELYKLLELEAIKQGVNLICATVSPKNPISIHNVTKLGFTYNRTLLKYNLERNLYYKNI